MLNTRELTALLVSDVRKYTTDAAAARAYGISRSHLCRVLSGNKPITARIAQALGYKRVNMYRSEKKLAATNGKA